MKVSWQVLRNFYLKNGVKYLASNYAYQQSLQQQKSVILDFAIELAQLVFDDKVVIYFDESSFNMWLRGRKTWQHPDEPVKLLINKARGTSVTLYGAIGSDMHKPFFMSAPATRQDYVVKFLTQLRKFVRHSPQTTLHLVIDNHPAHKTKLVEEACQRLNIQRHFMPGYSPEFNSIEALWGWIKRDVKKRLVFRKFEELTQPQFTQLLSESLGAITYEQQANAARYNNREFLHRTLGECIRREDYPHLFLDKAPAQDDDDSLFAADPLLLDDIQLLDRLDLEVQSQLSIGDMLNLQPSHGRTPSQASDIPHAEIRSDAQPLAFKAVRRYVQSKLDWWND